MVIFTSYYKGDITGEAVSISIITPPGFQGKHLPLFAPTRELLDWWRNSDKDETAIVRTAATIRYRWVMKTWALGQSLGCLGYWVDYTSRFTDKS
ncbi:hypothetical protein [Nostoc sp. MG11]|uniref:hypothetical protein n=1 Tax=Nostoc sp. MG11 TaxID=2721166 RepID=UPI001D033FE6|nr:hypothetical protein [Nostoc sp. MG11]